MNTPHLHRYLWAKFDGASQPYLLLAHLLDTATVISLLYQHWLRKGLRDLLAKELGSRAPSILSFLGGIHDLGKANPYFQAQPRQHSAQWKAFRTELSGHGLDISADLTEIYIDHQELRRHENISVCGLNWSVHQEDKITTSWAPMAVIAHHGKFSIPKIFDGLISEDLEDSLAETWPLLHERIIDEVLKATKLDSSDDIPPVSPEVGILISGLLVLADRIASQAELVESGLEQLQTEALDLNAPEKWAAVRKDECLALIEKTVGIYHPWPEEELADSAILGGYPPRFTQEKAVGVGDGLWNVMAPTGSGKTEAALLRHSRRNERLIFLLPTQATTNAIMRRIQKAFQGTHNVAALAHSLAVTEDFYQQPATVSEGTREYNDHDDHYQDTGGLYPTEFIRSGASRLLAPVCVGTVDQALMGSLPSKFNHLRLLALANAHIVIDEVHTLDQYQAELMEILVKWWSATNTPVTFLTATMPAWQRDKFSRAYTGFSSTSPAQFPTVEEWSACGNSAIDIADIPTECYAIPFHLDRGEEKNLVRRHAEWVRAQRKKFPDARIGVICNTVDRAQQLAVELEGFHPVVLHSRMTAEHRNQSALTLEKTIGKGGRTRNCLVIGTQAIEASLDIDLDLLRTELCPAPSLIQRAGRLWRRQDPERNLRVPGMMNKELNISVIKHPTPGATLPYLRSLLQRVENWLERRKEIKFPTIFRISLIRPHQASKLS
ncbi:CRISPR-associated helicase Cas3' [Corynebacterium poyangense]|uniref:CRISPR-associated helicase Cas3' n=1 Tax=Corynebacterium poyangense TaxID=2684405 RepID=UPI0021CD7EE2|nr:CRISPR-associated helicase Cas3' [Corynebacterium poyangense]